MTNMRYRHLVIVLLIINIACAKKNLVNSPDTPTPPENSGLNAEVIKVEVSGNTAQYVFSVTVKSPDTGCDQYADWWEVITLDGELKQRRILAHSHVTEQPFTRSGNPVDIAEDETVYVRAHMNNGGYGTTVMKGSKQAGFSSETLEKDFAIELAKQEPLPKDCDF